MGSLPVLYSITLFSIVIMAVIFSFFTDTTTIKSAEGKFERTIDTYFVNIQLLPLLLIPIMWYETPKIAISFNAWSHLEVNFKFNETVSKLFQRLKICNVSMLTFLNFSAYTNESKETTLTYRSITSPSYTWLRYPLLALC